MKRLGGLKRATMRGVTLVEVMIVIVIMGVIAGVGVGLVWPRLKEARVRTAVTKAGEIKTAAKLYQELSGSDCPTIQELINSKRIDGTKSEDPWGSPYKIKCEEGNIQVISPGQDKKDGTPDDCRDDWPTKQVDIDKVVNG